MAALTDLSDVVNRVTGGSSGAPELLFWYKDGRHTGATPSSLATGRLTSLWEYTGLPCCHGSVPGAASAPDNTTIGGMLQTDPAGGAQKWMIGAGAVSSTPGVLILYDRLLHIGGLNGTTLTAQAVGGSLTRYTSSAECVGNQIWIEIYTAIGGSSTTISAVYLDQDGNSSTTQAAPIGNAGLNERSRIIPLSLTTSDTGVQGVTSVTLAGSTGTAGNFGVTIARPLLMIPSYAAGVGFIRDLITGLPSITEVKTDACLAWAWMANLTAVPQFHGFVNFIEK